MSTTDRERWDAKYAGERGRLVQAPDRFVLASLERLGDASGDALDLAAGTGRHALELARRGWRVEAWEASPVGLALLTRRATDEGLSVTTRVVDLEGPLPEHGRFDLVCVADFLDRHVYGELAGLLSPGGHAIVTTFTIDYPGAKPPRAFRLERGELARGLPGLTVLAGEERDGRAGILARRDP